MIQPDIDIKGMGLIARAQYVALMAHAGSVNKHDGELYLLHVARVAHLVHQAGGDDVQIAVAWLHDVVEDTAVTREQIREWFSDEPRVFPGVVAITHPKGESNEDYLNRLAENYDGSFVKYFGDSMDNFRRNHLIVDPDDQVRLAGKYSRVFHRLAFVARRP